MKRKETHTLRLLGSEGYRRRSRRHREDTTRDTPPLLLVSHVFKICFQKKKKNLFSLRLEQSFVPIVKCDQVLQNFATLAIFGYIFEGILSIWQNFEPTLAAFLLLSTFSSL